MSRDSLGLHLTHSRDYPYYTGHSTIESKQCIPFLPKKRPEKFIHPLRWFYEHWLVDTQRRHSQRAEREMQEHNIMPDTESGNVLVNTTTSMNSDQNRHLHATSTLTTPVSGYLKRELASSNLDNAEDEAKSYGVPATRKRQRTEVTTKANQPVHLPPRITRSRSSSSQTTTITASRKPLQRKRVIQTHSPSPSGSLLRDTIPPNLILLLVGVNPGIMTGTTGYAYAHPSNHFWKLLHSSGITKIRHPPSDTYKLPELYSVGNTNIIERPTRDASMLSQAELDAGVLTLEAKVAAKRPDVVCLVGKGIWEAVWRVRHGRPIRKQEFRYGWQDQAENMGCMSGSDWGGARVFVATTTSGLAAGMSMAQKEAIWAELGTWVEKRRVEKRLAAPEVDELR